jgi:Flp pilus assembly pilin Flp
MAKLNGKGCRRQPLHPRQFGFTPTSWSLCFSKVLDVRLTQSVLGASSQEAGMRLLSDESGATKTEYAIIAAGKTLAVTVAVLPVGATFLHFIAGAAIVLALATVMFGSR